jgi:competence ComEA-like helix-hairpin-helix protein
VILYSRYQLALLLGLVVAGGGGLLIGEWRRANPEMTAAIEAIDRVADDDRGVIAARRTIADRAAAPSTGPAPTGGFPVGTTERPPKPIEPARPLDLNRASATELTRLPGIGPALADRIVAARDSQGPFASVDDLRRVRGVGPAKLAAFREHVTVSP